MSVKPCSQEVIVLHNILYVVYFGGSQFTESALLYLDFSLSQAVSMMKLHWFLCLLDTPAGDLNSLCER